MEAKEGILMKKTCLLTGAGGRLGTAFCRLFHQKYNIIAVYRNRAPDVASQLQQYVDPLDVDKDLPENADPVYAVQANLSDPGGVDYVVDIALAKWGGVDLLVNAAGDLARFNSVCDFDTQAERIMRAGCDLERLCPNQARGRRRL